MTALIRCAGGRGRLQRGVGRRLRGCGGRSARASARRRPGPGQQQGDVGAVPRRRGSAPSAEAGAASSRSLRRTGGRLGGRTAGARPVALSWSRVATARVGRRSARKTGPAVRPASRRGSSWAQPGCQNTHSVAPPLERTRARLFARSRSLASGPRTRWRGPGFHTAAATASVPQRDVLAAPRPLQLGDGERPRPVGGLAAALDQHRRLARHRGHRHVHQSLL